MPLADDISIRKTGKAGRITLTRPEALNALTYDMCMAIGSALDEWAVDDEVGLVLIDAEGSRSFCSGGDIAELYRTGKAGDFEYGRKFWADEYRVNAKIYNYSKPYVALMNGIVMGGGVGISALGSYRIVTENTLFAMPECGIGLVPDVGGNMLLSRAPGAVGEYLASTGTRLKAGDSIYAGIADVYVPEAKLDSLVSNLEESGDPLIIRNFEEAISPETLLKDQGSIDWHFSTGSAAQIVSNLDSSDGEWETQTAKLMRRGCPLSVAASIEIVRKSRLMQGIEEVLSQEYRFTWRSMSHGDFIEGIRAQIIDKDRNPKWKIPTLEALEEADISSMLSSLGSNELVFD